MHIYDREDFVLALAFAVAGTYAAWWDTYRKRPLRTPSYRPYWLTIVNFLCALNAGVQATTPEHYSIVTKTLCLLIVIAVVIGLRWKEPLLPKHE